MDKHRKFMRRYWRITTATILTANIYISMEWLFQVTKPSFLSPMATLQRIYVLLSSPFIPIIILGLPLLVIGVILSRLHLDGLMKAAVNGFRLLPAMIIASLSLILTDNFTYTILGYGIRSTEGIMRLIYVFLFLGITWYAWKKLIRYEVSNREWLWKGLSVTAIALCILTASLAVIHLASLPSGNCTPIAASAEPSNTPNILLVSVDGLEASHLSMYGYSRETSPNIKALAKRSLVALNAFPSATSSGGSIASIFTSKWATTTRVFAYPDILRGADAFEHLPGILRMYGYETKEISVPYYADYRALNLQHSFEAAANSSTSTRLDCVDYQGILDLDSAYFLTLTRKRLTERISHILFIEDMPDPIQDVAVPAAEGSMKDDERIAEVESFIESTDHPFLVHVHLMGTHGPVYDPSQRVFSRDSIQHEQWMPDFYDDAILDTDRHIAELIEILQSERLGESTIIVITSDHAQRWKANIRVPLLIHFPHGEHSVEIDENVALIDIAPTILDYLDVEIPDWMEGESMLSATLDPQRRLFYSKGRSLPRAEGQIGIRYSFADREIPLTGLASLGMIVCDRWYEINMVEAELSFGKISSDVDPCDVTIQSSLIAIQQDMIRHLNERSYDIHKLRIPIPSHYAQYPTDQAIPWKLATNIPMELVENTMTIILSQEVVQIRFPIEDPRKGDAISIEQTLELEVNETHEISFDIWDQYRQSEFPGRFEQRVYIDDELVWSHDISAGGFRGWIPLSFTHIPKEPEVRLRFELLTIGEPEVGWNWGRAASIGIRNVEYVVLGD